MKFSFVRNIGSTDRILRIGFSLLMIYFGFFSDYLITDRLAGILLGSMGIGSLIVAFIGHCPMYGLVGFSTYSHKTQT